jgi:hypothetical protein
MFLTIKKFADLELRLNWFSELVLSIKRALKCALKTIIQKAELLNNSSRRFRRNLLLPGMSKQPGRPQCIRLAQFETATQSQLYQT